MRDLALIVFTVAMFAGIGLYLWATLQRSRGANVSLISYLVALGLAIVGMLVSLFHLGTTITAYYAVINIGSSWLSREITFSLAFIVLLIVAIILDRTNKGREVYRIALAWLTTAAGLFAILSRHKHT